MPKQPREEAIEELDSEVGESPTEEGLVSLKRTKAEVKERETKLKEPCSPGTEDYPWGLSLTLDADTLKKLGIKNLPGLGQKMSIEAVGEVVSASSNMSKDYESKEVRLQLTAMKVE